jgi:hypothetical protein
MTTRSATTPSTIIFASIMSTRFLQPSRCAVILVNRIWIALGAEPTWRAGYPRSPRRLPNRPVMTVESTTRLSREVIGETPFFTTYTKASPGSEIGDDGVSTRIDKANRLTQKNRPAKAFIATSTEHLSPRCRPLSANSGTYLREWSGSQALRARPPRFKPLSVRVPSHLKLATIPDKSHAEFFLREVPVPNSLLFPVRRISPAHIL